MATNQYIVNYTVGPDAYNEVPRICGAYGKKAVIIGGKKAMAAGVPVLKEAIKDSDITITDCLWYGGEAAIEYAEELAATQAYKDADMVFAFGGGKGIDIAKYATRLVDHKPFFTFPTIAATCAAASAEAIMYYTNHEARDTYAVHETATHVFINTQIIADAPDIYLWAGIGDTMAKHFETSLAVKDGHKITMGQALGVHLGEMCYKPLVQYGAKAMEDCKNNIASEELERIAITNIITTGIVSCHVGVTINSNAAHAICYGTTLLPQIEERHLHGEVVSYCTLVLLFMDGQLDKVDELFPLYKAISLPTKLADIEIKEDELKPVIEKSLDTADMGFVPYEVTYDMVYKAIMDLEKYNETH